ncbi:MAG TPA: methyltransferase domain-containing protein [Pyrinomonadaceae bacterium]|jgi:glycosyltransferase involved in cell wall biosynthesis/SAM-dependent methyltransferase|nr:methyltransferase domain-containing protein [Pyrinomonadaceae bacterium]
MKLAYFSPLTPQRSGIADYSEELLPRLSDGAQITLFVDGFEPASPDLLARLPMRDFRRDPSALRSLAEFDAVVYHLGNDHRYHAGILEAMQARPGVVVFHDFALQEFFLGLARERGDLRLYLDEVGACHGEEARRAAAEALACGGSPSILARPVEFPLNCRVARSAEAIVVHSEWSRARLARVAPGVPVAHIRMPVRPAAAKQHDEEAAKDGEVRIANFGLITPGKGIEHALRALSRLKDEHRFRYTLVGDPNPFFDVREVVRRYRMEERVGVTGHVSLDEFERRIAETDIALNLRERTVGETSASLCRIMAAGVCAVVIDVGWYSELPDDCVVKVPLGAHTDALLAAYLERLIEDSALRRRIGENARRYALAEHSVERAASDYLAFIGEVAARRPRRRLVSSVSNELALLGVGDADESVLRGVAADIAALAPAHVFESDSATGGNGNTAHAFARACDQRAGQQTGEAASVRMGATTRAAAASSAAGGNGDAAAGGNGDGAGVGSAIPSSTSDGRMPKIEGVDYKRAAVEYLGRLSEERRHHLRTKPFYNLANRPTKYKGEGLDEDARRHFCDFANMAVALALPAGSRVLDVGCGSGWLSEYFARLGYEVRGIDISPDLVEMSRERVARVPYGVDHETSLRCTFQVHDIERAPLAERFDAVICYDSLHHFEDERAVVRHLAAMLPVGGQLFILEGERPPAGSRGEEELREVMREFRTLESPFDHRYLRALLDEQGFAVVGDYVSVNGLFERDRLEGDRLPLLKLPTNYHYFTCKKVCEGARASTVPDSRRPGTLAARFQLLAPAPARVAPGEMLVVPLAIENTGDTLWLTDQTARPGVVMPAVRVFDREGALVSEFHGEPLLPRAVAPGETVELKIEYVASRRGGAYTLKLDLVDQHVCWFEQRGSEPLLIRFDVV